MTTKRLNGTSASLPAVDFRDVVGPTFIRRITRQTQFEKRVARELGFTDGERRGFGRGLFFGFAAGVMVAACLALATTLLVR